METRNKKRFIDNNNKISNETFIKQRFLNNKSRELIYDINAEPMEIDKVSND